MSAERVEEGFDSEGFDLPGVRIRPEKGRDVPGGMDSGRTAHREERKNRIRRDVP